MARADLPFRRPRMRPLAAWVGALCSLGALAQTAPMAGSPADVAYTPVQGLASPLFPRQGTDARGLAPRTVARVVLEASADGLPADGLSVVRLTLRLFGADGKPLAADTQATLELSGGRLRLPGARTDEAGPQPLDADPAQPGVQVTVRQGVAEFDLVAPAEAQDVRLRASAGGETVGGELRFLPDLRPMIAAGLIEGVIGLRRGATLQPVQRGDAFEREIEHWSRDFDGGRRSAAARAAFYLKGTVRGDLLLTAAYDSDKETRARLLRDIQPDAVYPVYGDASLRSFDARSGERLYLRLDKGRSYALYGDFVTGDGFSQPIGQGAVASLKQRSLGAVNRSASGVRLHHEGEGFVANAWALRDTLRQVVEELASQGSGPYGLRNGSVLEGSEKVEVIVRDRDQPSRIVAVRPLLRLVDYTFEPFSGRILLSQFLGAVDADLNPQSLRVTYEVDQGGEPFWVGGADGQWRLSPQLELGGAVMDDANPLAPRQLASANATWVMGPRTALVVEAAGSRSEVNTNASNVRGGSLAGRTGRVAGEAWRVEFAHESEGAEARVFVGRSDPAFDNPSAPLQGGRGEALARGRMSIAGPLDLVGQAQRSEDRNPGGGERELAELGLRWRATDRLTLEGGLRTRRETVGTLGNGLSSVPFGSTTGLTGSLASGAAGGALGYGNQALDPSTGLPLVQQDGGLPQAFGPALPAGTRLDSDTVRLGLGWRAGERLTLGAEVEHEVDGADRRRVALGADWRLSSLARLYGRWERQSGWTTLQGVSAVGERAQALVFGIDGQPLPGMQAFSEYRLRDAVGAADLQLASGVRRQWTLAPGLGVGAGAERIQVVRGNAATATALHAALDWTADPLWRASARTEWRRSADLPGTTLDERFDTWLWTGLLARKLDRDWTVLARHHLLHTDYRSRGDVWQNRAQLGLAWRDTDTNRGNALAKLEFKRESDASNAEVGTLLTRAVVASTSAEWHPSRPWWLSGRVAAKWQRDRFEGGTDSRFRAQWVSGRLVYDLSKRWDVSVAAALQRGEGGARQTAVGAELGYLLATNLWVSAGWNRTGFRGDADLSGYEYTQRGAYLRLRFKFDETLFQGNDPAVNRSLPR